MIKAKYLNLDCVISERTDLYFKNIATQKHNGTDIMIVLDYQPKRGLEHW